MKFLIMFIFMAQSFNKLWATEKDLYDFMWLDPDKKVYVLQNKVHKKEHTIYLNIGYGSGLASNFIDTTIFHSNAGFYLNEEWAIEVLYSKYSNKENDSFKNIKRINGVVPFIRKPVSSLGATVKYSPFYGKINTFNKIFYFDWSFGLGVGKYVTESNKDTVSSAQTANTYTKENNTNYIGKTEITLHATKNIHLSLGLIFNNYSAQGPTVNKVAGQKNIKTDTDAIFTIGYSF